MILKAISLENFKGIREPVRIELKPITLLFGPNSAGKSTILQALVYAREVLERHNLDPDRTLLGGEWMDLGGFESLVHQHDKGRPIRIGFELDLSQTDLPDYLTDGELHLMENWEHSHLPSEWLGGIKRAVFNLEIAWSEILGRPIVQKLVVDVDGEKLAVLESTKDGRNIAIRGFNHDHHAFLRNDADGDEPTNWFYNDLIVSSIQAAYLSSGIKTDDDEAMFLLDAVAARHSEEPYSDFWRSQECAIGLNGQSDALPRRGRALELDSIIWLKAPDLYAPYSSHPLAAQLLISSVLSGLIVGPLDLVCHELDNLLYIGPLREVPKRHFQPQRSPDPNRWARGEAAWDVLQTAGTQLVEKVNQWLEGKDKFDSEYQIAIRRYKLIDMDGPLFQILTTYLHLEESEYSAYMVEAPVRSELKVLAAQGGSELEPADLGVGISQVIPVITAAIHANRGIVAIEQPELHIHPAWQVVLGDLFLSQIRDKSLMFLIETHSEHLVLRMMRRMRETFSDQLPPGAPRSELGDVGILYVESDQGRTIVREMPLNEAGELVKAWPGGFFEERLPEVLG
jgi:predicted ATPase